jgi:3'-phosphoadenosine 5'-phosphosulfate (PAPS) 3'-phosphatase
VVEDAVIALPESLRSGPFAVRLEVAIRAAASAGAALLSVRGSSGTAVEQGDQLKTSVDKAAEGWVLGWLEGEFPNDPVLAEERFSAAGVDWEPPHSYWTVDALDGTRSFAEGYAGFCVQLAWVEDGVPQIGVIAEPVSGVVYAGVRGGGAFRLEGATNRRLSPLLRPPSPPRFVDSIPPKGIVAGWIARTSGTFVECGSCGLKLARIAEGAADYYAKRFRYRLWDVAPGHVLLSETGGKLSQWDGSAVDFRGPRVEWDSLLISAASTFDAAVAELAREAP